MAQNMTSVAKSLIKGAKEAVKYAQGQKKGLHQHRITVPEYVDVKAIRQQLKLSRSEFSAKFGFSTRTIEKWEQGTRIPDTAARAYLTVIAYNSKLVFAALNNAQKTTGITS
jgi:putative transcriptional regulator